MDRLFRIIVCFLALAVHSSSCSSGGRSDVLRIGVDEDWYPLNFGPQQPFVNGFTEEFLMEVAQYSGLLFEKVGANWDNLLQGLAEEKYDAVITSLPPYPFHLANYDFSHNFISLGPVLIVPMSSKHKDLGDMKGELLGLIAGDPASLLLQKHPDVILRNYVSIPELLNAVANGDIEGALLNRIPAVNYINDLYANKLKIGSGPLTNEGLHLVTAKGKQQRLMKAFDQSLAHFEKKKKLQALLKKWNLASSSLGKARK